MRTMFVVLFSCVAMFSHAQIMHKVYVHPGHITSTDTITIETQIAVLGTCSFVDSFSIVDGNTIQLSVCYLSFETSSSVIGRDTLLFKLSPLPDGMYTVRYSVHTTDDTSDVICRHPDLSDSTSQTFTIGTNRIVNDRMDDLKIYPNPATNLLAIQTNDLTTGGYQITTTTGQLLLQSTIAQPNFTIDVSTLPPGLFFLSLTDGRQRIVKPVFKAVIINFSE